MGNILNLQRRAIEALRHNAQPPPLSMKNTPLFLADGTRLYLWGVSTGVGSCADIQGMDVLGVGMAPSTLNIAHILPNHLSQLSKTYAYVVLVRPPTDAEREPRPRQSFGEYALGCVELLRYVETDERGIWFERTGDIEVHVNVL